MKFCRACKTEKEDSDFYRLKSSKDGLAYYCKACSSIQNKKVQQKYRAKLRPIDGKRRCSSCLEYKSPDLFGTYNDGRPRVRCLTCEASLPPATVVKKVDTWAEGGRAIYDATAEYLATKGFAVSRLPADFPYSTRALHDIKNGVWGEETLKKLPFEIEVEIRFKFVLPGKPKLPSLDKDALAILRSWMNGETAEGICSRFDLKSEDWAQYEKAFLANGFKNRKKTT